MAIEDLYGHRVSYFLFADARAHAVVRRSIGVLGDDDQSGCLVSGLAVLLD